MKKTIIFAAISALGVAVSAVANPPEGGPKGGGFMKNLTDEQKACVEKADCPKMERKGPKGERSEGGEKPERPELSDEEKAAMKSARECMKKAAVDCGIEMPERPEGGRPPRE